MINFKQPVSMKVTYQQYKDDLKKPLKALGYEWKSCYNPIAENGPYLVTNFSNISGLGFSSRKNDNKRNYIDHYSPKLFLAIAAMTEGKDWVVGEYLMSLPNECDPNKLFKCKEDRGCNSEMGCASNDYKKYYRKATLKELTNYFTESKSEFVLPEKWCIALTNETILVLEKWTGETFSAMKGYIFPNKGWGPAYSKKYLKITFEQFKEHVLSKEEYDRWSPLGINDGSIINHPYPQMTVNTPITRLIVDTIITEEDYYLT